MVAIQTFGTQPGKVLDPRALYELSKAVAGARRVSDVYEAALRALRDSLQVEKSSILLFDQAGVMRFKHWQNLSGTYRAAVDGHSPWSRDSKDPAPVLVPDVSQDESLAGLRSVIEEEGIAALAFIPLLLGDRLLGKFMLYYPEPHNFSEAEILVAQAIACQVAFAIDQQEHRKRRDYLDGIMRSRITGVAEMDLEGRFIMMNDRYCEIVGRSRSELLGVSVLDITHPDDREDNAGLIQSLSQGVNDFVVEKRYVRPDGVTVWVTNSVSVLYDEAGSPAGMVALSTDITSSRIAQETSTEMARRYRNLVQALGLAVYTTDANGVITTYNQAAVDLWGRQPGSKDLWCGSLRIFDADGAPMELADCPMAVAIREERAVRGVEIIIERPDGERVNILPYPTPLYKADGSLAGAVNVLVNITDLKQALNEIEARKRLITSITDTMSGGLLMVDGRGNIVFMNPAAEKLTGYSFEEVNGRNAHDILHPYRPDGSVYPSSECPLVIASREDKASGVYDEVFMRSDGTFYDVVCNVGLMVEDGIDIGAIFDIRDITREKQAERNWQKSEDSLRGTAALKDQFLGLVSHELRTPISTILGNGLLLARRGERLLPEDRQQALDDIVSEAGKLQEIVENLLLLTRLEAGQAELEPLALDGMLREAIAEFEKRSPDREISLEVATGVPDALAQRTLAYLVVTNLISNAVKYSPAGSPVEVRLYVNPEGRPEVTVRDYGIGMDATDLENVFAPFYRSARAKSEAKGMGLGLAVCKRVIEAQSGVISVTSEPDQGSEFKFSLQPARA